MKNFLIALFLMLFAGVEAVFSTKINCRPNKDNKTAVVTQDPMYKDVTTFHIPSAVVDGDGVKYTITGIGSGAFDECRYLTSVEIPNTVTNIEQYAFSDCPNLTSITLPSSITNIEWNAFKGCNVREIHYNGSLKEWNERKWRVHNVSQNYKLYINGDMLTQVVIPKDIKKIAEDAFYGCNSITSVVIPNSVDTIFGNAFYGCSNLTSVSLPNSVTCIRKGAFKETGIWADAKNWEDGVLYIGKHLICAEKTISGTYALKDGTVCVADEAFYGCKNLNSVLIPKSVSSIGIFAFTNVLNITYSGPAQDTQWGAKSINGYRDDSLVYSDKKKTKLLACSCMAKGEVVIPNTVTCIGEYAFSGCDSLNSIIIPNGVQSIEKGAFLSCDNLLSVTIPRSVKSIGRSAFWGCSSLLSIDIPEGVTCIKNATFRDCKKLMYVEIPSTVTSIEDHAFLYCKNLKYVICRAATPPAVLPRSLGRLADLYVPKESVSAYKTAAEWKNFTVKPIDEYAIGVHYETHYIFYNSDPMAEKYLVKALEHYRLSAEEGNANAMWKLGSYYYSGEAGEKNYAESVKWLTQSIEKAEKIGGYEYPYLGYCYFEGGYGIEQNMEKAMHYFLEGDKYDNIKCWYALASIYLYGYGLEPDARKAVTYAEKLYAKDDQTYAEIYANSLNMLAYTYFFDNNMDLAISTIDKAISVQPSNANYYDSKGEFLVKMGKMDEALKIWKKIMELNPDFLKDYPQSVFYNQLKEKGMIK